MAGKMDVRYLTGQLLQDNMISLYIKHWHGHLLQTSHY